MTEDRRIHARVPARLPARVRFGAETVEGVVENIGQGGAFFATEVLEVRVDDGAEVEIEFDAPLPGASGTRSVRGTVLRSERYFDGQSVVRAFAIRFESLVDVAGLGG